MFLPPDNSYSTRPDTPEQQEVYRYIRSLAALPPEGAIQAFYRLLWDCNAYPDEAAHLAWQKVIKASDFDQYKLNIINRCYYTLINPWHLDGMRDSALEQLIQWLDTIPSQRGQNPATRNLRDTLHLYKDSDYYSVLKKHLYLLDACAARGSEAHKRTYFGDLFPDYFFIYEAGTQTHDIEKAQRGLNTGVLEKRDKKLRQYHHDLNQFYVRYQRPSQADRVNPTHLLDDELYEAIDLYRPKRQNGFKSQSDRFKARASQLSTLEEFKHTVYEHVMQPIRQFDPPYELWYGRTFGKALDSIPDDAPLTRVMIIQLFRKLVNTVIKYDDSQFGGDQFSHLVKGKGARLVTSILINIVLACEMVRFELEKRFAGLHHQFARDTNEAVQWLVRAFDYMNVALALNAKHLGYFQLRTYGKGPAMDSL